MSYLGCKKFEGSAEFKSLVKASDCPQIYPKEDVQNQPPILHDTHEKTQMGFRKDSPKALEKAENAPIFGTLFGFLSRSGSL